MKTSAKATTIPSSATQKKETRGKKEEAVRAKRKKEVHAKRKTEARAKRNDAPQQEPRTAVPSSITLARGDDERSITDATASLTTLTTLTHDIERVTTHCDNERATTASATHKKKEARAKKAKEARTKRNDAPQWEPRRLASECRGACKVLIKVLLGMIVAAFVLGGMIGYALLLSAIVPYGDCPRCDGSWIAFAFVLAFPVVLCLALALKCCEECDE